MTSCNQSQFNGAALIGEQARRHPGIRTNTDRDPRVTLIQPILKTIYVLVLFRCGSPWRKYSCQTMYPNQVVEVDFTDATARQKVPESFEDEKPIVLKGLRFDWNAELVRHIEVPTSGTR